MEPHSRLQIVSVVLLSCVSHEKACSDNSGGPMVGLALDKVVSDLMRGARNLELRARDTLDQHPHFRGRAGLFQYECCGDVLIVRGTVPTFYLKQLLQTAL